MMTLVVFLQDYDDAPRSVSTLYQNFFNVGGATGAADKADERGVEQFGLRLLQSSLDIWNDLTLGAEDDVTSGDNRCTASATF